MNENPTNAKAFKSFKFLSLLAIKSQDHLYIQNKNPTSLLRNGVLKNGA